MNEEMENNDATDVNKEKLEVKQCISRHAYGSKMTCSAELTRVRPPEPGVLTSRHIVARP